MESLSNAYNTDKNQTYLKNYERYFFPLKNKNINLLELGIHMGGSLLLWRDYFLNGKIAGLDINPVSLNDETGRIHIYQGMQQDEKFLDQVRNDAAPEGFDIIIDDASHIGILSKICFWHLFNNHLKQGGIYVIEDWRTGYWDTFIDGKSYKSPKISGAHYNMSRNILNYKTTNKNDKLIYLSILYYIQKLIKNWQMHIINKRFPSHNYGMVGFVKELVDELGVDMITNPDRGSNCPQIMPKFDRIEFCQGQVFVIKSKL